MQEAPTSAKEDTALSRGKRQVSSDDWVSRILAAEQRLDLTVIIAGFPGNYLLLYPVRPSYSLREKLCRVCFPRLSPSFVFRVQLQCLLTLPFHHDDTPKGALSSRGKERM